MAESGSRKLSASAEDSMERGRVASQAGDFPEAIEHFRQAVRLESKSTEALQCLGFALQYSGEFEQALDIYDRALGIDPGHAALHTHRAMLLLRLGRFEAGWQEYEWRLKVLRITREWIDRAPLWDGRSGEVRRLLIHCEQGIGDSIQFVRFLPEVRERVQHVTLLCQPALNPLLTLNRVADEIIDSLTSRIVADAYIPMGSLPRLLSISEKNASRGAYLSADPELENSWKTRIRAIAGFRVGIVWQGSRLHAQNTLRSIPLEAFAGLADVPGVRLVGLQKGGAAGQIRGSSLAGHISNFESEMDEDSGAFMDTAAILQHLDLVVSIDSAVGHLSAALGRPTWLLLPEVADWRWMLDRNDSPWYPSVRLWRKVRGETWPDVFDRVRASLARLVAERQRE